MKVKKNNRQICLYFKKQYIGIKLYCDDRNKIGYISNGGALNVSSTLKEMIGLTSLKWSEGNTNGGTREIAFVRFKNPEEALKALESFGFKIIERDCL